MFLPMSCTSPFTVARTIFPWVFTACPAASHRGLLRLHEREEVGDGLLHHARRLHHLRKEHLSRAEEVADDAHAVHQRPFDDGERAPQLRARLLGVAVDVRVDALHQRVREALLDRALAPLLFLLLARRGPGARRLELLAEVDEALGRVRTAVEQDVLDELAQLRVDLLVHLEHAGVDDAHVHAGLDGVVEERRVHRLADVVVAAEAERDVRHAAAHLGVRQVRLDPARGLDEVDGVVVVLLDAGRDGEDVRVEDDVLGRKADLVDQDVGRRARRCGSCPRRWPPGPARRRPSRRPPRRTAGSSGRSAGTCPRPPSARSS